MGNNGEDKIPLMHPDFDMDGCIVFVLCLIAVVFLVGVVAMKVFIK